ncbi:response regulator receiver protein [Brachybacterium vulturis]|uniref:Response regulator receiver protein n=1 Tax=Brachybacterium vulturis TaxID=2017484 RepID=A0A291GNP1_9MICO|nr:GAF and ANTAR domain-containing protein [Brachybacterium vulturis]ATG51646.1 response regulator receiver protein [Brachybacterium vulturis]
MPDDVINTRDDQLSTMQTLLLESEDISDFLRDFTALLADQLSLTGPDRWCAVTLLRGRKAATAVSSSAEAAALDELQNRFSDGPCMTAIRGNTVIRAGDLRQDGRWPDYQDAAVQQGVRAVLGIPFDLDEDAQAGLNVYSATAHDFDSDTIASIVLEVEQASNALRLAIRMAHDRESHSDLRAAMEHRTVIDLAVGIIMAQNRCSQDEAVALLKTASNHRNMKLRELASDLVASVSSAPATTAFES